MQENFDSFYLKSAQMDTGSVIIALLLTIILHILILWSVPRKFDFALDKTKIEQLKIEIIPPKIRPQLPEFIEANPYGNDQTPVDSKTAPESFKNQRAADEIIDAKSKSRLPFVDGESKESNKVVSGTSSPEDAITPQSINDILERPLKQPLQPTESMSNTNASTQNQTQTNLQQQQTQTTEKISDTLKTSSQTIAEDMLKTKISVNDPNAIKIRTVEDPKNKRIQEGQKEAEKQVEIKTPDQTKTEKPDDETTSKKEEKQEQKKEESNLPPENKNLPKPKQRAALNMKIPAGPLANNRSHASTLGTLSVDSRFSEFGAYQQRMIEAISRQWNLLASANDLTTAIGTQVVIEYSINPQGELSKFNIIFSNSTKTAQGRCEQSILTTAPYGEWTQEMLDVFGNQDQTVRINFFYR